MKLSRPENRVKQVVKEKESEGFKRAGEYRVGSAYGVLPVVLLTKGALACIVNKDNAAYEPVEGELIVRDGQTLKFLKETARKAFPEPGEMTIDGKRYVCVETQKLI